MVLIQFGEKGSGFKGSRVFRKCSINKINNIDERNHSNFSSKVKKGVLNIHRNVPGFLTSVNEIISSMGANIHGQYLGTNADIGFLIVDLDIAVSNEIKKQIAAVDDSIKTRILY